MPAVSLTTSFQTGATWCSIRPNDGRFASPIGTLQLKATTQALVGVFVTKSSAVIKVVEGSISLSTLRVRPNPVTVAHPGQRLVSGSGLIKTETLALSGEERVAIAQLRIARPTAR
jgi:hypothetical protein